MNQETNQTKRIEAYSIADFVKQIQDAVIEGYKINLEDNDKYPLQIGVGFYCTMDKTEFISQTEKSELTEATLAIGENLNKVRDKSMTVNLVVDTGQAVEAIKNAVDSVQSKPGRKPKGL